MASSKSLRGQKIAIFRNEILPPSETFIRSQAFSMSIFEPLFVGLLPARENGPLPSAPLLLCGQRSVYSRLRSLIYKATGMAGSFHKKVASYSPRLLHAHFAMDGAACMALANALDVPLIVTLHGNDVTNSAQRHRKAARGLIYLRALPKLWKHAAVFICVSDFIRRKAIEAGFPENKLRVHYIGVDLTRFSFCETGPTGRRTVLFVGRLVEKKGCKYLLAAMVDVQKTFPESQLVIIGDGPEARELWALASSLPIDCRFLGSQTQEEVRRQMANARVLCVPSVTSVTGDSEGLPTVVVESMAVGTPVVSCRHAGLPEIIEHGVSGLLSDEKDVHGLAQNISLLFANQDEWERIRRNALANVTERFDLHRQTRELEELYAQTITTGPRSNRGMAHTAITPNLPDPAVPLHTVRRGVLPSR